MTTRYRCRSCGAAIRWTELLDGRRMPVDAEPRDDGNVRVFHDGRAIVESVKSIETLRQSHVPLYVSHFATCPNADQHRRRNR